MGSEPLGAGPRTGREWDLFLPHPTEHIQGLSAQGFSAVPLPCSQEVPSGALCSPPPDYKRTSQAPQALARNTLAECFFPKD